MTLDDDLSDTLKEIDKYENIQKELATQITAIVMAETLNEKALSVLKLSYAGNKEEIAWRRRYISDLKSQMRKIVRDMDTMIGDLDDDKER